MSANTLVPQGFEIREGLAHFGDGGQRPYIDGWVDGQAVVTAFEFFDPIADRARWGLATFSDTCVGVGAPHPYAARVDDADQARQWVALIAALYAKATVGARPQIELTTAERDAVTDALAAGADDLRRSAAQIVARVVDAINSERANDAYEAQATAL